MWNSLPDEVVVSYIERFEDKLDNLWNDELVNFDYKEKIRLLWSAEQLPTSNIFSEMLNYRDRCASQRLKTNFDGLCIEASSFINIADISMMLTIDNWRVTL